MGAGWRGGRQNGKARERRAAIAAGKRRGATERRGAFGSGGPPPPRPLPVPAHGRYPPHGAATGADRRHVHCQRARRNGSPVNERMPQALRVICCFARFPACSVLCLPALPRLYSLLCLPHLKLCDRLPALPALPHACLIRCLVRCAVLTAADEAGKHYSCSACRVPAHSATQHRRGTRQTRSHSFSRSMPDEARHTAQIVRARKSKQYGTAVLLCGIVKQERYSGF
jgi:hypothetical protein